MVSCVQRHCSAKIIFWQLSASSLHNILSFNDQQRRMVIASYPSTLNLKINYDYLLAIPKHWNKNFFSIILNIKFLRTPFQWLLLCFWGVKSFIPSNNTASFSNRAQIKSNAATHTLFWSIFRHLGIHSTNIFLVSKSTLMIWWKRWYEIFSTLDICFSLIRRSDKTTPWSASKFPG